MFTAAMRRVATIGGVYLFLLGGTTGTAAYLYLGVAGCVLASLSRVLEEIDRYRLTRAINPE